MSYKVHSQNSKNNLYSEDEDEDGGKIIVLKEIPIHTKKDKKCCKIK